MTCAAQVEAELTVHSQGGSATVRSRQTVIAATLIGYVFGTGLGVILLASAVATWRDKQPWGTTISIAGREVESRVDKTPWGKRLTAVGFGLFGCLVLLTLYGKHLAIVLGWVLVVIALLAFGFLPVYFGIRIWKKPEWLQPARAPQHGEAVDIDIDVSEEGLARGASGWVVGRILLLLPPPAGAMFLIALGLGVWALEGLELANAVG